MKLLNVFLRSITLMAVASMAFEDPPACTLLLKVIEGGNGTGESYEWNCDDGTSILPLKDSFPPDAFESGVNTLHNGKIKEGQVIIEGKPDIGENDAGTAVKTLGDKEVLVVRVTSLDSEVGFSADVLKQEIFGPASQDSFNLATGYDQCSYGALTFSPTEDSVAPIGVYEVTISSNANGVAMGTVEGQVTSQMNSDLGSGWRNNFDYVMYCLPAGVTGGIAYAYINWYLSVYNNNWCTYPSAQMHELGHNLGLAHSGEGTGEYNDQSGMMGFSYSNDEGPVMCFNNPKNWQLQWYTDKVIEISGSWEGDLVGYADYGSIIADEKVVVKISGDLEDYYLGFNRKAGIASGTQEAGNQVTIQRRQAGAGFNYVQSWLLTKMNAGQSYTFDNFAGAGDLVVFVDSIDLSSVPAVAHVIITQEAFTPSPTPGGCFSEIYSATETLTSDGGNLDYDITSLPIVSGSSCTLSVTFEGDITDSFEYFDVYTLPDNTFRGQLFLGEYNPNSFCVGYPVTESITLTSSIVNNANTIRLDTNNNVNISSGCTQDAFIELEYLDCTPTLTSAPSLAPSSVTSSAPSSTPSFAPTSSSTISPSTTPSTSPSSSPTLSPTVAPSTSSSMTPTSTPTSEPTTTSSLEPTLSPTISPSTTPSTSPISSPSLTPTTFPSTTSSTSPSSTPTSEPTESCSENPDSIIVGRLFIDSEIFANCGALSSNPQFIPIVCPFDPYTIAEQNSPAIVCPNTCGNPSAPEDPFAEFLVLLSGTDVIRANCSVLAGLSSNIQNIACNLDLSIWIDYTPSVACCETCAGF